jgi:hypothetical protein
VHHRPKLTWLAFTVMALTTAGTAGAEPPAATAPTPASGPSPSGAAGQPAPVTPHPGAGGMSTPKKSSADATVDWSRMASRQAAAASAGNAGVPMPGAGGPIQSNVAGGDSLQGLHGSASVASPTAGQAARIVPDKPDADVASTGAATPDSVVRSQIQPAVATCYENDAESKARRPGRLVLLMKVGAAGTVDSVSVGINAGVSPSLVGCVTTAARAAKFAAPGAGGATVPAMFTFPLRSQGS